MGEKHVKYGLTRSGGDLRGELMLNIFNFVSSSGQNSVRFAYGSTAAAVSTSLGYGGAPSAYSDFGDRSFIVIEPVVTMSSGYRWQAFIERNDTSGSCLFRLSTIGGWEGGATKNFVSNSTNSPPGRTPPVTDAVPLIDTLASGNLMLISTSDLDKYGTASNPATYFRVMKWAHTAAEGAQFLYGSSFGSYIPFNTDSNTNPVYALAGFPDPITTPSYGWGSNSTLGSYNRVPPEFGFTKTTLNTYNSQAAITTVGFTSTNPGSSSWAKGINNAWVNYPVVISNVIKYATPGYFGPYNMLGGLGTRTDGTADSANEYMVVNSLMIRWKPSA